MVLTGEPEMPTAGGERAIGFWVCVAIVVGNMIASGVFLLPAALAPFGWNSVLGWTMTIAGALCLAALFAALCKSTRESGGPFAYTREAFGETAGFAIAWSYWISVCVGNAALTVGAVGYLGAFVPALSATPALAAILACAMLWSFTLVNCLGMRVMGAVQILTTALKIIPLLAVVAIAAFWASSPGHWPLQPINRDHFSLSAVTSAATLTLFAFTGVECATVPAGRISNPDRTIPRATMIGTIIAGILYILACSVVTLSAPAATVAQSAAPFSDFMTRTIGHGAGLATAGFALISILGALNGWIMVQGELPLAMARAGAFPAWFEVTARSGSPVRAHIVSSLLPSCLVLLNFSKSTTQMFNFLALLTTATSLLAYLACAAAALHFMRKGRIPASRTTAVITLLAGAYSMWTLYGAGWEALLWGLGLLLIGAPLRFALGGGRKRANDLRMIPSVDGAHP